MNRRLLLASAALIALQGCATAPGAAFSALEPVLQGKGNLYLYRKSGLYAAGAQYAVKDGGNKEVGKLYNASYLLFSLPPGKHRFSVEEGGFASPKPFDVDVKEGQNHFVEYDSSMGLLLGWGLLSDNTARTQAQAMADLKGLNRAN
jgi:hypothetical protein